MKISVRWVSWGLLTVSATLALSGCSLFKKNANVQVADCLDGMADTSGSWRRVRQVLVTARAQREAAVTAQRNAASAMTCSFGDPTYETCQQQRTNAMAAATAAGRALDELNPERAERVMNRENPMAMLLESRQYEAPAGVASNEVSAAKSAAESMWRTCRLACRDLRCTGR